MSMRKRKPQVGARRRKPYVDMEDLVSPYFRLFETDHEMLPRVVEAVSLALKEEAKDAHRQTFTQRSGEFISTIWFKQRRKRGKAARLYAGNLASIYEKKGAFIQPMNGAALRFFIDGKTVFHRGVVRIPPRPYFYPAMREAIRLGVDKQAADRQIRKEIEEYSLG